MDGGLMALKLQGNGQIDGLDLRFQSVDGVQESRLRNNCLDQKTVVELTTEEKLMRIGLTLDELRDALNNS
jgi:hypothetical protein